MSVFSLASSFSSSSQTFGTSISSFSLSGSSSITDMYTPNALPKFEALSVTVAVILSVSSPNSLCMSKISQL